MTPDQVADLLGTMAIAGTALVAGVLVITLVDRQRLRRIRRSMAGTGLTLAAAVAVIATAGSLWFSEGAHFTPCELCWYQRIAMYPLALILPLGALRADTSARRYGMVLAAGGALVSAWHNLVETFPSLDSGGCDPANPCTLRWVEGLGFWTIPRMAFVAFALVITLLALDSPSLDSPSLDSPSEDP